MVIYWNKNHGYIIKWRTFRLSEIQGGGYKTFCRFNNAIAVPLYSVYLPKANPYRYLGEYQANINYNYISHYGFQLYPCVPLCTRMYPCVLICWRVTTKLQDNSKHHCIFYEMLCLNIPPVDWPKYSSPRKQVDRERRKLTEKEGS